MEQKLSDTLVKTIDRSNPMMQNLQLASRFNKLVEQGGGGSADLEDNKEVSITSNGIVEITPTEGKDGMKKVTANVNVPSSGGSGAFYAWYLGSNGEYKYLNINIAPNSLDNVKMLQSEGDNSLSIVPFFDTISADKYTYVSDTTFTVTISDVVSTFTRDPAKDITL